MYIKNEIRGIWLNDGTVAVAKVMDETDHFLVVENMVVLVTEEVPVRNNAGEVEGIKTKVSFEDIMPFAEIVKSGLDTKLPQSSVRFTFKIPRDLEAGYKQRTSLLGIA